jgi:hypothetical protein
MSPLDIAAFAAPIFFIIAIFSGPSGMAVEAVMDLAIFSLATSTRNGGDGRKCQARHSEEMSRECMFFPKLGNFADRLSLE